MKKLVIFYNTTSEYPLHALVKHSGYLETLEQAQAEKYEDQTTYEITLTCRAKDK